MAYSWQTLRAHTGAGFQAFLAWVPSVLRRRPWLTGLGLLLLLPVAATFLWLLLLPWPLNLRWRDPVTTSFMEYRIREAREAGQELAITHYWVPLEDISMNLHRAVLAAEDDRFYQHEGIDWRALAEEVDYQGDTTFSWWSGDDRRALRKGIVFAWGHRDDVKGRSTITQQLAKNLYFTPRRSMTRKVSEALVARRLETFLTKNRILELYLNTAEWGPGIFGAEAAARIYFGKGASELTLGQAATLAATLPHPLSSNPSLRPAQMQWRRERILNRLRGPIPPAPDTVTTPPLPDTSSAPDTINSPDTLTFPDTLNFPETLPGPVSPKSPALSGGGEKTLPAPESLPTFPALFWP